MHKEMADHSSQRDQSEPFLHDKASLAASQSLAGGHNEGLTRIGCFCGGILDDYKRRIPFFASDIRMGYSRKTISSALFMFFATFASTVALGEVIKGATTCTSKMAEKGYCIVDDNNSAYFGVTEYLLMNSVAGMFHAAFGCQPLLVLRPTGPITAFCTLLFNVAKSMDLNFSVFFGWTGVFVGFYMLMVAAFDVSRHIGLLTRFLHEIFAFFVCSIYIVDGTQGILKRFLGDSAAKLPKDDKSVSEALFAFILTVTLLYVAFNLHALRKSKLFTQTVRQYLVDYALTIALLVCIFVSYLPKMNDSTVFVQRISLPDMVGGSLSPTLQTKGGHRPWGSDLSSADGTTVGAAALAAIPIVIFFFFDQNVSSLMCQRPEEKLTKGSYYHSSFMCMGLFDIIAPSLGLPFVTGSLPHSPQMVQALRANEADRRTKPNTPAVYENRVAPFLMYFLIGAALIVPFGRSAIETIPNAAVDGILIFVGVAGLFECQLWARLGLLLTDSRSYPAGLLYTKPLPSRIHLFTFIQLSCLGVAWLLNGLSMSNPKLSPLGLCFPIIIMLLVPFRIYIMPQIFSVEELDQLDNIQDIPEDVKEAVA